MTRMAIDCWHNLSIHLIENRSFLFQNKSVYYVNKRKKIKKSFLISSSLGYIFDETLKLKTCLLGGPPIALPLQPRGGSHNSLFPLFAIWRSNRVLVFVHAVVLDNSRQMSFIQNDLRSEYLAFCHNETLVPKNKRDAIVTDWWALFGTVPVGLRADCTLWFLLVSPTPVVTRLFSTVRESVGAYLANFT